MKASDARKILEDVTQTLELMRQETVLKRIQGLTKPCASCEQTFFPVNKRNILCGRCQR